MSQTEVSKSGYTNALDAAVSFEAPEWAQSFRAQSRKRFDSLEWPHHKLEAWRFTNVNPIVRTPFQSLLEPTAHKLSRADIAPWLFGEADWTELVFVDGFYAPELSRIPDTAKGLRVSSLRQALSTDSSLARGQLGVCLNCGAGVFAALNGAFTLDGAVVHIEPHASIAVPVHVLYISMGRDEPTARHPRNLVLADEDSEATLIEHYVDLNSGQPYFNNAASELQLADSARLCYAKLLEEGPQGYHMATTAVRQARSSVFTAFSFALGGQITRNEISVRLEGEGAECGLHGLYLADEGQLVDHALSIEHLAPRCTSRIHCKGVLDGKSHAVFSGRVYVHRGAQKTDSKQLNQNLLRSDKAMVDTKPLLEIFADDVQCTHGATVGQPPDEQIFYFQTRGMSRAMAIGMLAYGFADEVVQEAPIARLRERLDKHVFDKYSPK